MAIACVYCGGAHDSASDVRACWLQHQGQESAAPADAAIDRSGEPALVGEVVDPPPARATVRAAPAAAASGAPAQQVWLRRGPLPLARNVVVAAGGEVPDAWADAERIVIGPAELAEPETVRDVLVDRARQRQAVVIELVADFAEPPRSTTERAAHELGARFEFVLDHLHHLVWSNAIDCTGVAPRWPLLDAAAALGATVIGESTNTATPGDVALPDGRAVWLDGGPLRVHTPIDGCDVIHAVVIEHGSLTPPAPDRATGASLAPDQRAAVDHAGGAARIIAPAGSGKTRVLTERARSMLERWRIPPSALSLVAFNKRAQEEMQARTSDLRGLRVRTLNAIALAIINGAPPFLPQPRAWATIDEPEVRRIIGRLVQFPRKRNTDPIASWIDALSMIRLGLRDPADVEAAYGGDVDGLAEMWPRYRRELDRAGVVDFDDQIARAVELLLRDPDSRLAAQRACRVLLVDEFQDLTPAHVLLVRLLASPGLSVFGVGDDDQTIYGYSGADPAWLIDFAGLFPDAAMHPLEVNYRCPGDVVIAADRLVRHNRRRVAKQIRSAHVGAAGLSVVDDADTLTATVDAVTGAVAAGRAPADIAVLTRVNALLAPVQAALVAAGIDVQGGVGPEFLERTAVRAALAWVRVATAPGDALDRNDLAEALRRPSRPLHPNVANWVGEQSSLAGLRRLAGRVNNERDAGRIAAFAADIERLRGIAATSTTADLIRCLADEIGLGASIATLDDSRRGMNRAAQNDDLVALAQLATLQPDATSFGGWLRELLARPRRGDGVTLATVHRVKGQEWPLVVVHHAAADQFPHRLAEEIEEERRVFHVAITRASERLVVVGGATPSRFIAEMGNEPPAVLPVEASPVIARSLKPARSTPSDRTFAKDDVLAAPGLVLIDGGQEWTIVSVDAAGAVARLGGVVRRFAAGASVVTAGRQRGALRVADASVASSAPSDANVRAHDLLRQARDRLRQGKPAYVVFDDKTLQAIAMALPGDLAALARIPGIGPAKLEQYGDAILVVIEDALASAD